MSDLPDPSPVGLARQDDRAPQRDARAAATVPGDSTDAAGDEAAPALMQVRLSPDTMRLDVCLAPEARRASRDELARALCAHCLPLALNPAMSQARALECLAVASAGQWVTVTQGKAPIAPVNGSITFLVRPATAGHAQWFHPRVPIRKGEAIIRICPGRDGQPGYDLRGNELAAAPARQPVIPEGENTVLAEDELGPALLAACDGELVVDHLKVTVRPAQIVTARELAHMASLAANGNVFVVDRVPARTEVIALGEIFVAGDVDAGNLISRQGSITVLGCVTGYHTKRCTIQAAGDVNLASVLYAGVETPANIRIQTQARNATLEAGGHLYLMSRLRGSLYDVELRIAGAVVPTDWPGSPADIPATERNTFLVPCDIGGLIALYDPVDVTFRPCHILDLSIASARVRVPIGEAGHAFPADRMVLLKFSLPGVSSPVEILGRTTQPAAYGVIFVTFRQLSHQDEAHITAYCLAFLRAHSLLTHHADEAPARIAPRPEIPTQSA